MCPVDGLCLRACGAERISPTLQDHCRQRERHRLRLQTQTSFERRNHAPQFFLEESGGRPASAVPPAMVSKKVAVVLTDRAVSSLP